MATSDPMPRILLATLALLLVLAAPAAAQSSKSTFTIKGAGFGHGVGMSQYGALGYAQQGWNAADPRPLLHGHGARHDRRGQEGPHPARPRDLLGAHHRRAPGRLAPDGPGEDVRRPPPRVDRGGVLHAGRRVATFKAPLQVAGTGDATTLGGHGTYRGVMEFKPGTFSGLTVTNVVGLDDYLQGVVPAESPAVVAGRSAARAGHRGPHLRHHHGQERGLRPLRGHALAGLQGRRDRAALDQRGRPRHARADRHLPGPARRHLLLLDPRRQDRVVENTSSGREPRPWLVSVVDEFDNVSPRHRWTSKPTMASASKKLGGLVKGSSRASR